LLAKLEVNENVTGEQLRGPPDTISAGPASPSSGPTVVFLSSPLHSFGTAGQETIKAFQAMSLQDPVLGNWNMDTGASSYINDFVHSLSEVLNMCIYPSA
nr:ribonuclease H-like domain-containing protein [Tanacetum cinerariifolium]